MNKLKAAIIGCGAIYRNHADALVDSQFAELKLVVDINEERAKQAAQDYNCIYSTDFYKVLEDKTIDVIHLCTPHYLHGVMAKAAMKSGKHVFTEKPMSISTKEAKEMIKDSKEYNRHLAVCFQNRYNNTSVKAKEILEGGSLGSIKGVKGFVTWYRDENYYTESGWRGSFSTEGGGVLINQSIHTIDLIQWLAGGITRVKANVDTRKLDKVIEVEDTADATFVFNNGSHGIYYATNCYSTNSPVEIEIHCEKGMIQLKDEQLYVTIDGKTELVASDKIGNNKYKSYWGLSHSIHINNFYRGVIEDNSEYYVTGEEGIKTLEIIEAIYRSSAGHRWINL
jgi:UDP-N-acetyl-2-amino-2-deoxyglucuronate dehydrogenase